MNEMTTNNGHGSWTGVIVGTVVGAAVGAGVALLMAPRTGKETRTWLARGMREVKGRATNALEQARETVRREQGNGGRTPKDVAVVGDQRQ